MWPLTYLVHDQLERRGIEQIQLSSGPSLKGCLVLSSGIDTRNDGHRDHIRGGSFEDNLRCKPSAESAVARQWFSDQSFQDTALSRRLISDHDDLRQINNITDTASEELINFSRLAGSARPYFPSSSRAIESAETGLFGKFEDVCCCEEKDFVFS